MNASVPITPSAPAAAARGWLPALLGLQFDIARIAGRGAWPLVDLLIRAWLAQAFFVSGVLKLANWDNALYLAAHEYPVDWMDPVAAAWTGVSIELLGPALLLPGLATRAAAAAMLALTLVTHFEYVALDLNLLWAALLGAYVCLGAGPLSLDRALRGLADSAVPLAAATLRANARFGAFAGPLYMLLLRAWIGGTLITAALAAPEAVPGPLAMLLPLGSVLAVPAAAATVLGALLALGAASRYVSVALALAGLGSTMTGADATLLHYWLMVLAPAALLGPGALSIDALLARWLRRRYPQLDGKPAFALEGLPRVVIVGAGFGGIACARALARAPVEVTLVDRANYHLFQPLLYQVATTALSPGDIATPVRGVFREDFNVRVLLGTVTGVDTGRQEVQLGTDCLPYDFLVVATGATHAYFGREDWQQDAPGLKQLEDATEIRRRLLTAFERAEASGDDGERRALTTFLIVGAGPTGVELAGAIAELARFGMEKDFRRFDPADTRVVLVQSGPRVLPTFPDELSQRAQRALERLGVEVLTNSRVEDIDARGVIVSGRRIEARTVLWAAGVVASPAARWLGCAADRAGRIPVGDDLAVAGLPNVYAIGDTALSMAWKGEAVPGLAPAAKQGGAYVGSAIRARVTGSRAPGPFRYRHMGSLATIGRKAAVVQIGPLRLSGAPAWWLWGLVHVGFLVGWRNRIATLTNWFWSYLTYRSAIRLITGVARTTG